MKIIMEDNVQLRKETDYGIRCLVFLAMTPNDYIKAEKIAEGMEIPVNVIPRVLSRLKHAGLVTARIGLSGGHKLAKAANQITLWDIVSCMEDTIILNPKRSAASQQTKVFLSEINRCFSFVQLNLEVAMKQYTVADLI